MPATRPEAISNRIRLTNKARALARPLVAERRAIDAVLWLASSLVDAVVDKLAPDEERVERLGSEYPLFAGADEQAARAPVGVAVRRVVPLVESQAVNIAILRQPPIRHAYVRRSHGLT